MFPNDAGYTDYSSAGTTGFIPEIWSGKLQVKFYKTTVLGEITNNDFEGEIKNQGDKVTIRTVPTITVSKYKRGMDLGKAQVPSSAPVELLVDRGNFFQVVVDDVNDVQSDLKLMDLFTNDASEQMKIATDEEVLAEVPALADAANKGDAAGAKSGGLNLGKVGAPLVVTAANVVDFILDCGLCLDEQNVPESGRWIVIPAWMGRYLKGSDLKNAQLTGDSVSPLRNGKIGEIDRFTIYVSNSLLFSADADAAYSTIAGTRDAITFASQISNVETLRSQSTFGNIVRGLNVFGFNVIKPEALVAGYCKKG